MCDERKEIITPYEFQFDWLILNNLQFKTENIFCPIQSRIFRLDPPDEPARVPKPFPEQDHHQEVGRRQVPS